MQSQENRSEEIVSGWFPLLPKLAVHETQAVARRNGMQDLNRLQFILKNDVKEVRQAIEFISPYVPIEVMSVEKTPEGSQFVCHAYNVGYAKVSGYAIVLAIILSHSREIQKDYQSPRQINMKHRKLLLMRVCLTLLILLPLLLSRLLTHKYVFGTV